MKKIFIILILSILPIVMFAKIETTYLSVQGVGDTKSDAIRDALIESIKQRNGVSISSKREYYKSINEIGVSSDGDSSHTVAILESSQKRVAEATKGFIRNYSIKNAYKKSGQWHVDIEIKFLNYKAPGYSPHKRRKIAILPFDFKSSYAIFNKLRSGRIVSDLFTQSLISKMTQSRKFSILDRENDRYYQQEKNIILSVDTDKQELLKLGKRLGADYLLVGKLLDFSLDRVDETSNIGLPTKSYIKSSSTISYRIIVISTGQIKWSETVSQSFNLPKKQTSLEAALVGICDKMTDKIVENILQNIYPPKIVAVTPSNIIINQGGNTMHQGDIYTAYAKGERLVDPYTNEFLGYEEIEVAKVAIINVKPKVSYAKIVEGWVSKDMILRKSNDVNFKKSPIRAATDVQIGTSGGVILPFD